MRKNKILSELRTLIDDIECGWADVLEFKYEIEDDYSRGVEKIIIEFIRPDIEPKQE